MFYFFRRDEKFVRCELRTEADGYELIVVHEDGRETAEHFDSEEEMAARWSSLQREYARNGWWGPHGRE